MRSDVIISDDIVIFSLNEQKWQVGLQQRLLHLLLLFDPEGARPGSERADAGLVSEKLAPLSHPLRVFFLELARGHVMRVNGIEEINEALAIVELISPYSIIRGQGGNTSEHATRYWSCRHVCCQQSTEGAAEKEDRSFVRINFELLHGFKYEKPLVSVHVFLIFNYSSLAFGEAETALVHGEYFIIVLSEAFSEHSILVGIGAVPVNVEDDTLSVVLRRIPVRSKLNLLSELLDFKVNNILLCEIFSPIEILEWLLVVVIIYLR